MAAQVVSEAEVARLHARLRANVERRIREGFRKYVYWRDAELREFADRINPQPRAKVVPFKQEQRA